MGGCCSLNQKRKKEEVKPEIHGVSLFNKKGPLSYSSYSESSRNSINIPYEKKIVIKKQKIYPSSFIDARKNLLKYCGNNFPVANYR